MSDVITRANNWLDKQTASDAITDGDILLDSAVEEIHRLRRYLYKIARLGSNAATDSYLDECGKLAFEAIHLKETTDA